MPTSTGLNITVCSVETYDFGWISCDPRSLSGVSRNLEPCRRRLARHKFKGAKWNMVVQKRVDTQDRNDPTISGIDQDRDKTGS